MGAHPDFGASQNDAQADTIKRPFRLLLSHTPDCLNEARRQKVDLMLAGHNHGGQVVLPVIGPVYSPSLSGCRYSGGTFWAPPTLLQVSRGLSGRHPLRINCRPEITRLILRTQPPSV
jgi:predicted MPP superfamily phosphohydrolase